MKSLNLLSQADSEIICLKYIIIREKTKLQEKTTQIMTQISVLKAEVAAMQLSKSDESNLKTNLHLLKIFQATISITCNTGDCQKKCESKEQFIKHQRCHSNKDAVYHCREYVNGEKYCFSSKMILAMQQHSNMYQLIIM